MTPGWELTAPINAAACRALAKKTRADAARLLLPQLQSLCHQHAMIGGHGIAVLAEDLARGLEEVSGLKIDAVSLCEELALELRQKGFEVVLCKRDDHRNWERRYMDIRWGGADA